MQRGFLAAAILGIAGLSVAGRASGEDLVTRSGTMYRDVLAVRVEPDGVTWRHDGGLVKVDFADSPDAVRRAYHYDAAQAAAYQDTQARARHQTDEQAQRDAHEHEARQRARVQAAMVQTAAGDADTALVLRRALSPAASIATREIAARLQAEADRLAALRAVDPDPLHLIPVVPGVLGPRPINRYMDTLVGQEYAASLHQSPTGAGDALLPAAGLRNTSVQSDFFTPLYATRSYYEDTERAREFARDTPAKP